LKSKQDDTGVGKVDLLGVSDDKVVSVIEIKLGGNQEDKRIGLVESLIYAAIIEANIDKITAEFNLESDALISNARPRILLVAPPAFWMQKPTTPSTEATLSLIKAVADSLPINIQVLSLMDAELVPPAPAIKSPQLVGHAFLASILAYDTETTVASKDEAGPYLGDLIRNFWRYADQTFGSSFGLTNPDYPRLRHPPVFKVDQADANLLYPPYCTKEQRVEIASSIPPAKRHRAFGSMRSSQALAQSVFGGLRAVERLDALETLLADDGVPAFYNRFAPCAIELEHEISSLGEPRSTSIDVLFSGAIRIAVEVKLTEDEFGQCSRPGLTSNKPGYAQNHCDGSFTYQRGRSHRCSLAAQGIEYWQYIPEILTWPGDADLDLCPLRSTYQIVRNLLAASIDETGHFAPEHAHTLIIYDARNPAFWPGGYADRQWWAVIRSLKHPRMLRRVSWQKLTRHLSQFDDLAWLHDGLRAKYGFADQP
jgi:hypothetical protein